MKNVLKWGLFALTLVLSTPNAYATALSCENAVQLYATLNPFVSMQDNGGGSLRHNTMRRLKTDCKNYYINTVKALQDPSTFCAAEGDFWNLDSNKKKLHYIALNSTFPARAQVKSGVRVELVFEDQGWLLSPYFSKKRNGTIEVKPGSTVTVEYKGKYKNCFNGFNLFTSSDTNMHSAYGLIRRIADDTKNERTATTYLLNPSNLFENNSKLKTIELNNMNHNDYRTYIKTIKKRKGKKKNHWSKCSTFVDNAHLSMCISSSFRTILKTIFNKPAHTVHYSSYENLIDMVNRKRNSLQQEKRTNRCSKIKKIKNIVLPEDMNLNETKRCKQVVIPEKQSAACDNAVNIKDYFAREETNLKYAEGVVKAFCANTR
jgi:hypothetical protein